MPFLLLLISLLAPQLMHNDKPADWTEQRLVAHALGGIDGNAYTNSYDAFIVNYEKGFRVFEVDLMLTSDGHIVARHDWTTSLYKLLGQDNPGVKNDEPLSLAQFKTLQIDKRYRPIDFDDILLLLEQYPDIYFVTDTKGTEPNEIEAQFRAVADKLKDVRPSVTRRIVPQLYNRKMYELVEDIFPFVSYIYTLYESPDSDKQVLQFVKDTPKVRGVTMNEHRVSAGFSADLKKLGVRTYVHTINDLSAFNEYRRAGIYGIYTDFIDEKDLEIEKLRNQLPNVTQVRLTDH